MSAAVAIVSGSSSGIGASTVAATRARGSRVTGLDVVDTGDPEAQAVDFADPDAVERAIAAVHAEVEAVDALVCSADVERQAPAAEPSVGVFRRGINVNVLGADVVSHSVVRRWIDTGRSGSIVLAGYVNSVIALLRQAAYAASQGAGLMLGMALTVDGGQYGIRVNVVTPGLIDTPMSRASIKRPERGPALLSGFPLDRPVEPDEVSDVAAFLAGPGRATTRLPASPSTAGGSPVLETRPSIARPASSRLSRWGQPSREPFVRPLRGGMAGRTA